MIDLEVLAYAILAAVVLGLVIAVMRSTREEYVYKGSNKEFRDKLAEVRAYLLQPDCDIDVALARLGHLITFMQTKGDGDIINQLTAEIKVMMEEEKK